MKAWVEYGERGGMRQMNEGRRREKSSQKHIVHPEHMMWRWLACLPIRLAGSVSVSTRRGPWSVFFGSPSTVAGNMVPKTIAIQIILSWSGSEGRLDLAWGAVFVVRRPKRQWCPECNIEHRKETGTRVRIGASARENRNREFCNPILKFIMGGRTWGYKRRRMNYIPDK